MVTKKKDASKGMWRDRKGNKFGADDNEIVRQELLRDINEEVVELFALLGKVEEAIDKASDVLSVSQPSRAIGKIGLRWWRTSSNDIYKEPVLVKWRMQNNKVMTPQPLKLIRQRTDAGFSINAQVTKECLDIVQGLMKKRAEIKNRISTLRRSLRAKQAMDYFMDNESYRLDILKQTAVQNLLDNGYEIEQEVLESLEP